MARGLTENDLCYVWAAYVKEPMEQLPIPRDLGAREFSEALLDHIETNFNGGWIIEGETREGKRPYGLILAWVRGRVIQVGDMIWFPWATSRGIYEGVVKFMDDMRGEFVVLDFAKVGDKKFFERVARHGVMRKVGHLHSIYPNEPAVLFETVRK